MKQKNNKKKQEIVVIFKQIINESKMLEFIPIDVKIGYFDPETRQFITDKNKFSYITDLTQEYGFALRMPLEKFHQKYKKKSIIPSKRYEKYFEKINQYRYQFYTTDFQSLKDFRLTATNKTSYITKDIKDKDINLGKQLLLEQIQEDQKQKDNYYENKETSIQKPTTNFDAKKLNEELKSHIIGQDEQIDDIITIIWQNQKSNYKSNILLIGPSGVGKTEIIRKLSEQLDIPMAIINVADVSQSAYQGPSISEAITKLVKNANNNIEKASHGIIYIDEIDKKADNKGDNSDIITSSVQDELLKLLEDNDYIVDLSSDPLFPNKVIINTKNITFICAGKFGELTEKTQEEKTKIGFNTQEERQKPTTKKRITRQDLMKFGLKNEIIGRLHNIIQLSPLDKEALIKIMKNPNNQSIQEKINLLTELGITLNLDESVYEYIAENAIKNQTGARGLISEIDSLFIKAMKDISHNPEEYEELSIDENTVKDNHSYRLTKRKKI